MMEVLRQEGGDQFSEEELAHASEVDREIERLKREVCPCHYSRGRCSGLLTGQCASIPV